MALFIGEPCLACLGSNISRFLNDRFGICIEILTSRFLCHLFCWINTSTNYDTATRDNETGYYHTKTGHYYTKASYYYTKTSDDNTKTGHYYTETGDDPA